MSKVQTAIAAIHGMTTDELNQIVEAVKLRRTFISNQAIRSFVVGDIVEFDGKRGYTVGKVTKVARKYVTVNCGSDGMWKVPASMLRAKKMA